MVPGEARAILRCSILPDTNAADFIVELRRAAGDDGLEWSIAANGANAQADGSSGESAPAAALSKAVRSAFAQLWPGTPVLPYLSPSPAGIQALRRHGIAAIGFTPPAAREPAPASGAGSGAQALVKIVNGL